MHNGTTGCTTSTPSGDYFEIFGNTGNDTIGLLNSAITCNGVNMNPWNGSFAFGMQASGGGGRDVIYGTPNKDNLYSKDTLFFSGDSGNDRLCGYDGDDTLVGDLDDAAGAQECLNGGNGTDTCNGGDSGSTFDTAYTCESVSAATTSTTATCSCGSAPPDFW